MCFPKREGVSELGCLPEPRSAWGLGVQVVGQVGEREVKSLFDSVFLFLQNELRQIFRTIAVHYEAHVLRSQ